MSEVDYDGGPICEVCADAKLMADEYWTCERCGSVLCPRCYGHEGDDVITGCQWCLR